MKKISVLTPTYNRISHLEELLWMFQQQQYPNKELIILNDNPDIEYSCQMENVRVINVPKMNTLGEIRQRLVDEATGDWLHFWDDDDVRSRDFMNKYMNQVEILEPRFKAISYSTYLYFEKFKVCKQTAGSNTYWISGFFSKEYCERHRFKPELHLGEDLDFIDQGLFEIKVLNGQSPVGYCWDNGVFHVSGELLDLNNYEHQIARKKKFEHAHLTGKKSVELKPNIYHDYFGEFEKFYAQ